MMMMMMMIMRLQLVIPLMNKTHKVGNSTLLISGTNLLCADDRSIGDQGEMNPWVGNQVGLELRQVNVERSVEPQRGRDRGDNLPDQPVQIRVRRPLDVQVASADVVDGLVVHHECAVGVLESGVGGEDGVIGLHHSSGDLRGRVDRKLQLGLLAVVNGEPFHEEGGEAGAGAATEGVEDEEALEAGAVVSQLPDPLQNQVDHLPEEKIILAQRNYNWIKS